MKYLIILMILSGCSTKFKVGDCTLPKNQEFYRTVRYYNKILEVGKYNYKYIYFYKKK